MKLIFIVISAFITAIGVSNLAFADMGMIQLYRCEQIYSSSQNGLSLVVYQNHDDRLSALIELNRITAGVISSAQYNVELDSSEGAPIIYKNNSIMLKISLVNAPGEENKKLATLITFDEGGGPDSESLKCQTIKSNLY